VHVFVLGATGGTGRPLVEQARERGHTVTAFVRSPEKMGAPREGVRVVKGDPLSAAELAAALPGHDAVLSALGGLGLGRSTTLGDSARSIVSAMKTAGVKRLLVVSAAVLFRDAGLLATVARHTFLRNVAVDSAEMERVVMESDLDWTIARPPRLTHGPRTGRYHLADGHMPPGPQVVSRADVAHFLLDDLADGKHLRRIVGLTG
jgi:putative NADH-flavin reductase